MRNLNYLMDTILYHILKIISNIYIKKHGEKTINRSIRICVNKTENRTTFKIKTLYHLELLTPETMRLHGSTKIKITKDQNSENVPYLEIMIIIIIISKIQESCIHAFLINRLANY